MQLASKRVVRSWATRRLRIAFTESLKNHGFLADGSRIANKEKHPLMGTVQMFANQSAFITMSKSELMRHMDFHVKLVLERQDQVARKPAKFGGQKSWNNTEVSRPENPRRNFVPPENPRRNFVPPENPRRNFVPPENPRRNFVPPENSRRNFVPPENPRKNVVPLEHLRKNVVPSEHLRKSSLPPIKTFTIRRT
ncbi:hypothetical protein K3495_g4973 [Podosphaera aphanis]|nr:hypothetical protein K3495_g4973 [Podosphaera aphanis]